MSLVLLTPVAQWIARRTSNPKVASSSLVGGVCLYACLRISLGG